MGVFGGDAEIVRQYAQFALSAAAEACKPCKPTFVEQAPLGRFCIDRGIAPALLKEWTDSPFPPGIHHLMRAKDHPSSLALVEKLARRWGLDAD